MSSNSWKTYFADHQEFAALIPRYWSPRSAGNSEVMRYYFTLPHLGGECYIQRRLTVDSRVGDNYYDAHRISKGDLYETTSDVCTWGGEEAAISQIKRMIGEVSDQSLGGAEMERWQRVVALDNQPKKRKCA